MDPSDAGGTWRDKLLAYNANPGNNPLGLLPAFELYENDIYRVLVKKFGIENTYILPAGWGLINAAFLTPSYDITFSAQAPNCVRRRKWDVFCDLSLIPANTAEQIVCFGSERVRAPIRRFDKRSKGGEDRVLQFRDAAFRT